MRKSHISRKPLRSKSPSRLQGSSRSRSMKHSSPGMKRSHPIPKRKDSRSPRLRSIASSPHRSMSHRIKLESPVSMDRNHSIKGLKYSKRKLSSSPVMHSSSSRRLPVDVRMPSYEAERYQSTPMHPQYSPSGKKPRRADDSYYDDRSASPRPPLHPASRDARRGGSLSPVLSDRHRISSRGEREKHAYDARSKHASSSVVPQSHSREKIPFASERSRYRSTSPNGHYLPGQKQYAPTLHERFTSVIKSNLTEPRIHYSRDDLEKITIDIKRNIKEPSPNLRIMNPSDIKLVRRPNEGHRPIFDREEIRHASRDLREDPYYQRKASGTGYEPMHAVDLRQMENYQITRHKFDSTSGRTLSDGWQSSDGKKDSLSLDRDEREKGYSRSAPRNYVEPKSRSRSRDRDFRSERYIDTKAPPSYSSSRSHVETSQSRSSAPIDVRSKFRKGDRESHPSLRSESKPSFHSHSDRRYSDRLPSPPPRVERRDHSPDSRKWSYKSSPLREKLPDIPRRPGKYDIPWSPKPDILPPPPLPPPRSSDYFEREGSYTRGSSRPFRSSRGGFRGRGMRAPARGSSYRGRGGFRPSTSPRGRGYSRR